MKRDVWHVEKWTAWKKTGPGWPAWGGRRPSKPQREGRDSNAPNGDYIAGGEEIAGKGAKGKSRRVGNGKGNHPNRMDLKGTTNSSSGEKSIVLERAHVS